MRRKNGQGWLWVSLAAVALAGCGGGGGGGSSSATTATDTGSTCVAATTQAIVSISSVEAKARSASVSGKSASVTARQSLSPSARRVALAELTSAKMAAESTQSGLRGAPRKVGFARSLPDSASTLDWQTLADGRLAASVSITSPSAKAIRLGLLVRSLPTDATVRVYAQSASTAFELAASDILSALQKNATAGATGDAAKTYWTPAVEGAEFTLEVSLPAGGDTTQVDLAVPQISHLFSLPSYESKDTSTVSAKIGESASCEVDAACDSAYQADSNAVAKIIFVDGGSAYQCTGTLLNDHLGSGTPYFLTANHCISTQAAASTLQTYWFYRAPSCGAGTLSTAATVQTGGATLLYASSSTDTSFMRLNSTPPSGAVYAAWSVSTPALSATIAGLHHPEGDLLKLSTGTVRTYASCTESSAGMTCTGTTSSGTNFLDALLTTGSTEGGSSGSALFQTIGSSHYVVGQLYGGDSSCSNRSGTNIYGRFDAAYNAALRKWLAATVVPTC